MSHKTYDNLLGEANHIIYEATRHDLVLQQAEEPSRDKSISRQIVVELYVRYIIAVNKLIKCYDQIIQPQKLIVVRKLLESCMGRIVELKHDLVSIDGHDFNYISDTVLLKFGITPMELELKVPSYFYTSRKAPLANWKEVLDITLKKFGSTEDEAEPYVPMTEVEAILLLQTHERARQGRLRSQFMKEIRLMKEKGKTEPQQEEKDGFGGMMAAVRIQKLWRGYVARRNTKRRKIEEMLLIGMLPPLKRETSAREKQESICEYRRELKAARQQNYEKELVSVKERLRKQRGEIMMEDMREELRTWLLEYKNHSGKLPEFPSEERGGSRMMFSRSGYSRQGTDSEMSKSTNVSSKESKGKKEKGKKEKDVDTKTKDDTNGEEQQKTFKPIPSGFLGNIVAENDEYDEVWKSKDEKNNPNQDHYIEMIVAEKTAELEVELRKVVDDMMRLELQQLQAALDRDKATKGKKVKKAGKKSRRGGKKSKKKKEKDLTPDRTIESLFEELVCNGIIKTYPCTRLVDYQGERSIIEKEWGSLGDIRQIIMEYCVMPLASPGIHENSPLIRSLLIAGTEGSGKKQLVYSICTETDSILFDISASNIVGKYPGKSGLTMLMHLVSKVSRLLQPSVIFIESAEKTFMRKVPKTDKSDPKRLKKDLPKLIKGITPEDRVMLIGVSSRPWDCDQKLLLQTYQHFMLIPKPSHADLAAAWRYLLSPFKALASFDTAQMARLSDGFTVGNLAAVVKEVMTCKRMVQLRALPLQAAELVNSLSKREPAFKEHEEALREWLR